MIGHNNKHWSSWIYNHHAKLLSIDEIYRVIENYLWEMGGKSWHGYIGDGGQNVP